MLFIVCYFVDLLSEDKLKMYALVDIEILLQSNGRSLYYYSTMPQPDMSLIPECQNKLIDDELNYEKNI